MRISITLITFASLMFACGRQQPENSRVKIEVTVPPSQIKADGVTNLMASLDSIHTSGRGTLTFEQLLALIPFTPAELSKLNQARDDKADVTCANDICTGVNNGQEIETDVSQMNLPNIGRPHVKLSQAIELKFRIGNAKLLDICSVEGLYVKKLFFWPDVQAAHVTLDDHGKPVESTIIASPSSYSRCN